MAKRANQIDIISAITTAINELDIPEVNGVTIPEMVSFLDGLAVKTNTRNAKANANRTNKMAALNDAIWKAVYPLLTTEPQKAIHFAECLGEINGEVVSANRVGRIFTAHADIVEKVAIKGGGCGYKLKTDESEPEAEPEEEAEEE